MLVVAAMLSLSLNGVHTNADPPALDVQIPCLARESGSRCARALVASLNARPEISLLSIDLDHAVVTIFLRRERQLTAADLQRILSRSLGEHVALPQARR